MTQPAKSAAHKIVANHHAHYPAFSGISGVLLGLRFAFGRNDRSRVAVDLAQVSPGDRAVDIGCGPGNAVKEAARRGASATGVDPAPVMLRLARLLVRGPRVDWREGAAEALPLPDGSATVAWSVATIHHWADVERGLAEVHRVIEPGGRFLGLERRVTPGATGHGSHGWTDEQAEVFADACRAAGFTDVTVETVDTNHGPSLAVRAKRHPTS
jgi:ubiquinone/menaquinone biosynthesis C-methylase UbiE